MSVHTTELEGLSNRASSGKKTSRGRILDLTSRETTRKIETTCREKPAKLQYRFLKSGQRVSQLISHRGCVPVQNGAFGHCCLYSMQIAFIGGHYEPVKLNRCVAYDLLVE